MREGETGQGTATVGICRRIGHCCRQKVLDPARTLSGALLRCESELSAWRRERKNIHSLTFAPIGQGGLLRQQLPQKLPPTHTRCAHTRTHTCTCTQNAHSHMHAQAHTHARACICAYAHARTHAHACICTHVHAHTYTCTHTHAGTHMHTHRHTHIYMQAHTSWLLMPEH